MSDEFKYDSHQVALDVLEIKRSLAHNFAVKTGDKHERKIVRMKGGDITYSSSNWRNNIEMQVMYYRRAIRVMHNPGYDTYSVSWNLANVRDAFADGVKSDQYKAMYDVLSALVGHTLTAYRYSDKSKGLKLRGEINHINVAHYNPDGATTMTEASDTTVSLGKMPTLSPWDKAMLALGQSRRVLLYGPPGTGKTYAANKYSVDGRRVFQTTLTEDSSAVEVRGMYLPDDTGAFHWINGPGINAWEWKETEGKHGGRLVINELDHGGTDVQSFMHMLLDDPEFANVDLPTRDARNVQPGPDFQVVATMNGTPEYDLGEALLDRFPVRIYIDKPHPKALEALPEWLRATATKYIVPKDKTLRIGLRTWYEFSKYIENGIDMDKAGIVVFGKDRYTGFREILAVNQQEAMA